MEAGSTSPADVFSEPYPCDDCPFKRECAEHRLSCKSFHIYANAKGFYDRSASRKPSLKWYYKTFVRIRRGEPTLEDVALRFV